MAHWYSLVGRNTNREKRFHHLVNMYLMTWTWAFIMRVSPSLNPSETFESSINFFQPQSCSFFQNRCKVSAGFYILSLINQEGTHFTSTEGIFNQPTRIFGFLWISIHNGYCKLSKMTPTCWRTEKVFI